MNDMSSRIGMEVVNSFGSKMILVVWRKRVDIDVYFPEYNWTAQGINYGNFIKGRVSCPYERSVFNIGYIGEGKYKLGKKCSDNESYIAWSGIIERCYTNRYKRYCDCTMSEEWLCFNTFSKWLEENIYYVENQRMCVDKDILKKGNKHYSKENCCIVPNDINVLFTNSRSTRGKYLIGVDFHKGKCYRARCSVFNENKVIGFYNTELEAFNNYKSFKEKHIKKVANMYKNIIPNDVYDAMINYKVDMSD